MEVSSRLEPFRDKGLSRTKGWFAVLLSCTHRGWFTVAGGGQLDQQTQVSRTDHRGYRRKKPPILRQADVCWLYGGLIVA
jgi:hypothetical protein